jgi:hypothetical protein
MGNFIPARLKKGAILTYNQEGTELCIPDYSNLRMPKASFFSGRAAQAKPPGCAGRFPALPA